MTQLWGLFFKIKLTFYLNVTFFSVELNLVILFLFIKITMKHLFIKLRLFILWYYPARNKNFHFLNSDILLKFIDILAEL